MRLETWSLFYPTWVTSCFKPQGTEKGGHGGWARLRPPPLHPNILRSIRWFRGAQEFLLCLLSWTWKVRCQVRQNNGSHPELDTPTVHIITAKKPRLNHTTVSTLKQSSQCSLSVIRPRLYLRFLAGFRAPTIVLRQVFQLGSIRILSQKQLQEARKIASIIHRAFAFASPIDTNDGWKRFLHWIIQKNANGRCKQALTSTPRCRPLPCVSDSSLVCVFSMALELSRCGGLYAIKYLSIVLYRS